MLQTCLAPRCQRLWHEMPCKLAVKLFALLSLLPALALGGSFVVQNDSFVLNDEALRLVTCECAPTN